MEKFKNLLELCTLQHDEYAVHSKYTPIVSEFNFNSDGVSVVLKARHEEPLLIQINSEAQILDIAREIAEDSCDDTQRSEILKEIENITH